MNAHRCLLTTWLPGIVAAAVLFTATVWTFYPGWLSWDSAYQWYQVRTGRWDNVHPVIMTLLWSLTDRLWPGPGGYFLLQMLLYWAGLAVLATALFERASARVATVALLGLFPPSFALVPHLWKDVGLLVSMIWTVALLAHDVRMPRRGLRIAALATLTVACAFRHNALPLALPFLWYLAGREPQLATGARRIVATALLVLGMAVVSSLPNHLPGVTQRQVWPVTATWDLAAMSVDTGRMLLPDSIIDAGLDLETLRRDFKPWVAVPIYASGKIRDSLGSQRMSTEQLSDLRNAWLQAIAKYPEAYLAHRARLVGYLVGFDPVGLPNSLVFDYGIVSLADNPAVAAADNAVVRSWHAQVDWLVDTPLFAFWLWALVLTGIAVALPRDPVHPLISPLLLSTVLLTVPLFIVAPGADFRFLIWPVYATPLVVTLAVTNVASKRGR